MQDPGRWMRFGLATMALFLGYALLFGKGGLLRIRVLSQQMAAQQSINMDMQQRNAALSAEVQDLRKGSDALEERARADLGMIRDREVYYRYVEPAPGSVTGSGSAVSSR